MVHALTAHSKSPAAQLNYHMRCNYQQYVVYLSYIVPPFRDLRQIGKTLGLLHFGQETTINNKDDKGGGAK